MHGRCRQCMDAPRRALGSFAALAAVTLSAIVLPTVPVLPLATPAVAAPANDMTPWTLPTRPAKCTAKQIAAVDIAGCLLAQSEDPLDHGWPTPPFPTDPATGDGDGDEDEDGDAVAMSPLDGWVWSNAYYSYNTSPALAEWEAQFVSNQSAIGRVKSGQVKAFPAILPLYEGFLRDITAGGYKIADVATSSFRCTSGTGKTCIGRTIDAISNHAWALALDMNTNANPQKTYVGVDGASACATPIDTDLPQWVIRTAEKWGLYWGGYGWSNGCGSPSDSRTSTSRDIHHFEFRGSAELAVQIVTKNTGGSCLMVVDDAGVASPRCLQEGEVPAAGTRVMIDTKAPAGATAALVNIAMTDTAADGYITADACGAVPAGPRSTSNGNTTVGRVVANLAVVPLDASGRFCLYRSKAMHTIVDVQGFFVPSAKAGTGAATFHAVAPARIADTRTGAACGPDGTCLPVGLVPADTEVALAAPDVPATATAILANLAITEPAAPGYLTADSCSMLVPGPQVHANTNYAKGDTVSNLAVVPVAAGTNGAVFCTTAMSPTHQVVDVQGWFGPSTKTDPGLGFTVVPTQRLVDTRECWTDPSTGVQQCATLNPAGSLIRIAAPAGASAVLVNLTLTGASAAGFATAQPCSLMQAGAPGQANANVGKGKIAGNLAVVGVDPDGTFCVRVSQPMHVIVDLQGTFGAGGDLRFVSVAPVRRSDTRVTA